MVVLVRIGEFMESWQGFSVDGLFRRTITAFRLLVSDALWSKMEPVLRELKHAAGSPPKLSNRMSIEAILYQARSGTSFELSGGERDEATGFEAVWEGVVALSVVMSVVMNKADDSQVIRRFLAGLEIEAVIHVIEQVARTFLAFVHTVAIWIMLR